MKLLFLLGKFARSMAVPIAKISEVSRQQQCRQQPTNLPIEPQTSPNILILDSGATPCHISPGFHLLHQFWQQFG
ncbi:hypothetical protein [Chamaesiphon sp. OTE_75_metabat_556]|uniref:hypothetical protein n=1 Tax=Chamaesiphon sp. OTE_75_metabat_556 TaxID=2964692 RepID=UPI00286BB8A7|nr:hypothetical protein [Chamaesiphon sp. OTE_75_metabat_556]